MDDIEMMLNECVQRYYANEYYSYQKNLIERNAKFLEDQIMIGKFISEAKLYGNLIDIGSGNCQWFPFFKDKINQYFAIDVNKQALAFAPKEPDLTTYTEDVFDVNFEITKLIKPKIDLALLSFFISHFTDFGISQLIRKIKSVNCILIIDSFWSINHQERFSSKELKVVERRISESENIMLPKRFFEYSDIERIFEAYGYSISKFEIGNYWFACLLQKN